MVQRDASAGFEVHLTLSPTFPTARRRTAGAHDRGHEGARLQAEARNSGRRVLAGERPMTRVARAVEKGETQGLCAFSSMATAK
jgi:hypothetical protein